MWKYLGFRLIEFTVKLSILGVYISLLRNYSQMFIYKQGLTGNVYVALDICTYRVKFMIYCSSSITARISRYFDSRKRGYYTADV